MAADSQLTGRVTPKDKNPMVRRQVKVQVRKGKA